LNQNVTEGATSNTPTPTDHPWDYDYLNAVNAENNFNIGQTDPNNVTADRFINYMINQGIEYETADIPPTNPSFPEYGQGVCMTDWGSITDNTNGVTGPRTVRMRDGTTLYKDVNQVDGQTAYNECLQFTNEKKQTYETINAFALQYGGQCFAGDTNYLALNSDVITNDPRTINKNQVAQLNDKNYCQRSGIVPGTGMRIRVFGRTFSIGGRPFASSNGSGWTQMVYAHPLPQEKYRFNADQYNAKIKEYVNGGLSTYSSVLNSVPLNREGFIEGIEPIPVANPITNLPSIQGVDNNILNSLRRNNFIVTTEEYQKWTTELLQYNTPVDVYLKYASDFGIHSEDEIYGFLSDFQTLFNIPSGIKIPHPAIIIITIILKYIKIQNIKDYYSFSSLVKTNELNTVSSSILKSNNTGGQKYVSLFMILYGLSRINVYWKDYNTFFGVWKSNNISINDTMNIIINILVNETFSYQYNGNVQQLTTLIQFATYSNIDISSPQIPSPVDGFNKFDATLKQMNMTYAAYISYYIKLQSIIGIQQNMQNILPNFTTYYNTVAYSDAPNHKLDNPVTVNTLFNDFIYVIDPLGSTVPPYFTSCGADFNSYLSKIKNAPFTVANIISQKSNYSSPNDTKTGETYCKFMTSYGNSKESFESRTNEDSNSMSFQKISNYIIELFDNFKNTLFNNPIEGLEAVADSATYQTFFGKNIDYSSDLSTFTSDVGKRELTGSDNITSFARTFVNAGLYYKDYTSICTLFDNFYGNSPMPILILQSTITRLSDIGVTGADGIVKFITLITNFGVSYNNNFDGVLNDMKTFNMGTNNVNIEAITQFINDMSGIGLTYSTPSGTQYIQNIMTFFVNSNLPLAVYYYGSSSTNIITSFTTGKIKCGTTSLPANFPSIFINALNRYSNSVDSYSNSLYDILNPTSPPVQYCDMIDALQEAYMIILGQQTYNSRQALIVPNVTIIATFVYQEEMDAIVNQPNYYSDILKRILMINDIANGMIRYSEVFKDGRQYDIDLYMNIAKFLKIFPVLSFQYLSHEFMSKCSNGQDCWYNVYVDPTYSECKASSSKKTVNYRPNPPVL